MAKILSNAGIVTGLPVEAEHVSQSVNALTGAEAYDITISGSLVVNGLTYPYVDGPADLPILTDGAGNLTIRVLETVPTASYVSSSNVDGPHGFDSVISSSYSISSSYAIFANLASSSLFAINAQQAENANTAISSSHTITASYALNGEDGKHAISASYALTASYVTGGVSEPYKQFFSGSVVNLNHKFNSEDIIVSVYQTPGSQSPTSIIPSSVTLTDSNNVLLTFSNIVTGYAVITDGKGVVNSFSNYSASYAGTASVALTAISSSYALTASYAVSSSHEVTNEVSSSFAQSASYALTASYALNVGGGLISDSTISDSTITDSTIIDTVISSSTITDTTITGSTVLDTVISSSTITDTTITGSTVLDTVISGSTITDTIISSSTLVEVIGSGSFSGSFQGDGSQLTGIRAFYAATASFVTSSHVQGPYGFDSIVSSSHAVSSSYAITSSYVTGPVATASYAERTKLTRQVSIPAYNDDNVTIAAGTPLYVREVDNGTYIVRKADASNPNKMPAIGVAKTTFSPGETTELLIIGEVKNINTFGTNAGRNIYVQTGSGGFTQTPPSSPSQIQPIGIVSEEDFIRGRIFINGPMAEMSGGSSISASYALTASYAITSSHEVIHEQSSSYAQSASYALTASYALNGSGDSISASYALTASYLTGLVESASFATTASYVKMADAYKENFTNVTSITANHNIGSLDVLVAVYETTGGTLPQLIIPQSVTLTNDFEAVITFATNITGYVVITDGKGVANVGLVTSASYSLTSSYAQTASYVLGVSNTSYRQSVTGTTSYAITHNLDEAYPLVQAYETTTLSQEIPSAIVSTGVNSISVSFTNNFDGTIVVKK